MIFIYLVHLIPKKTIQSWYSLYEPPNVKTYKTACAPSEDTDRPGHLPSLIRVFSCAQWVAKDLSFLHADREDSDQTGGMPRLIRVFAGPTCHFVGFVMRRLRSFGSKEIIQDMNLPDLFD